MYASSQDYMDHMSAKVPGCALALATFFIMFGPPMQLPAARCLFVACAFFVGGLMVHLVSLPIGIELFEREMEQPDRTHDDMRRVLTLVNVASIGSTMFGLLWFLVFVGSVLLDGTQ